MGSHSAARRTTTGITRKKLLSALLGLVLLVGCLSLVAAFAFPNTSGANAAVPLSPHPSDSNLPAYTPQSTAEIAALPAATYSAVIPGLLSATTASVGSPETTATLNRMAPLFGAGAKKAVARIDPSNFTGQPTVIDVIKNVGAWSLILTPARQTLPSLSPNHHAAAQTAAWIPTLYLSNPVAVNARIKVSTSHDTLTIIHGSQTSVFTVGIGSPQMPSPIGVTGYLQARYRDAANGTGNTTIQLTSLHSSVQDNPGGVSPGGLIALHWFPRNQGAISHGCIRLTQAALSAVNALPLGTPVEITQ